MADTEQKTDAAKREEEILAFWDRHKTFQKSLEKPAPNGEFVFYDGPPFATGLPHYGHMLPSTIKDAIPRYKTMRGYHVPRRWGWDCHGLPLENQIEKELNLATKRDIEKLGVATFNHAARSAVLRYADEWKKIIPRLGRWVDMENDYRTMDATYTESVWWAFKELHTKGLVYEGFKAMHLCPRCGTTLSNFEVAQGYKDITDISVTVKLPLKDEPSTSLLAWTTTPWTLPGNMAAAVNPNATYVKVRLATEAAGVFASAAGQGGNASAKAPAASESVILAKDRLATVIKGEYEIEKEFPGRELVGKSYTPPFPYFAGYKMEGKERAWKVYGADFVTMTDGTGIVHIAPGFGADDLALAQRERIPVIHHVDKDGLFIPAVTDFAGIHAKPKEDHQSSDILVIKYLAAKDLLFAKEKIIHSYPHCWRCDTPLLNYATSSWFVAVTKFSKKLVAENKKIHWVPEEVGDKRFGNWLENARDWAISRARYWGAPIPVWRNPKTKALVVIGSLDELKKHVKKSGNTYFIMRHGEAQHQQKGMVSCTVGDPFHLTARGTAEVEKSAEALKTKKIDHIVVSPFVRTGETAEIVRSALGLPESAVTVDQRLAEYDHGIFNHTQNGTMESEVGIKKLMEQGPETGESLLHMRRRLGEALDDLERKYQNKNILIVSHGWPLAMAKAIASGAEREETFSMLEHEEPEPAAVEKLPFSPLPHNENYELDFHRPFIDEVKLVAQDGTHLERVHDVFDCWFESGSMSYAQNHYPFEHKDIFEPRPGLFRKGRGYPADFISESLDQTRGWFYSLLVLGTALFGRSPYQNVIVSGIVLAEDGQKMSKRLKNYPELVPTVEKYGADAIRYYLLASPLMRANDLNFSEKGVGEVASKVIGRLLNVLSFYELYRADTKEAAASSRNPLDRWILSRLSQVIREVEEGMESYELDKATRPLALFVDDLSTWYLRRSRDRFKEGSTDAAEALLTTRTVLETFARTCAPFIPFTAEYVYLRVKGQDSPESVHLAEWPQAGTPDEKLIMDMNEVREVVSLGLEKRQKANIKVRQPLARAMTKSKVATEYADLVRDELNVKEVVFKPGMSELIDLDTEVTEALRDEGELRDLIREVQDLRKKAGLNPKDRGVLVIGERGALIGKHWDTLRKSTNLETKESGAEFLVRKQ